MDIIKTNLKSIIISVLIITGLVVTVYLIKNPKIFKSHADEASLNIKTADDKPVEQVNGVFTTTSDHIKIGVGSLEGL